MRETFVSMRTIDPVTATVDVDFGYVLIALCWSHVTFDRIEHEIQASAEPNVWILAHSLN